MMRRFFILSALALVVTGQVSAAAQRFPGNSWAPREGSNQGVPLEQVVRQLRMEFGGQHLDTQQRGGVYVIAWITDDGRRLVIEVDASSGRRISVRG